MKRSGFTMIELVFVIVILGILASVAIPKLAATRDDAQIAKATSEVSSLIQDIGSYYTAHGQLAATATAADLTKVTNVYLAQAVTEGTSTTQADAANTVDIKTGANAVYFVDKKRNVACMDVYLNDTNGTVKLEKSANADNSIFCKGLVNALSENGILDKTAVNYAKTYSFGGSAIYQ